MIKKSINLMLYGHKSKKERKREERFKRKFKLGMRLLDDGLMSEDRLMEFLNNDKTDEILLEERYRVRSATDYINYKMREF